MLSSRALSNAASSSITEAGEADRAIEALSRASNWRPSRRAAFDPADGACAEVGTSPARSLSDGLRTARPSAAVATAAVAPTARSALFEKGERMGCVETVVMDPTVRLDDERTSASDVSPG